VEINREARKILAKRNFEKLMMEVVKLCGRLPLAGNICLPLGLVMAKKATALSAQLLKLVQTGSGDRLKIEEKVFNRIHRHKLFHELESMLRTVSFIQKDKCKI
jgi:hypothetical protein